nr:Ig domain-containing protein [Brucella intermedia]
MKRKWLPLGALLALTTTAISSTAYAGIHSVNLGEPFSIQLNECGSDRYQLAIPPDGVTLTSSGLLSGTTFEPGAVRLDLKCVRANDTVYSASTTYLSANMPSTSNVNFRISGVDTQTATIDLADYHSPLLASFEIDANNKPKNGTASISGTVLTYTRSGNWAEDTFRIQGVYVSPTGVTQRGNFGTVTVSMDVNKPESRDLTIDASATSGSFLIDMATHFPGIASAGPLSKPSQGVVTRVTNTGMRYDPPAGGVTGSVSFQFTLRDAYGNNSDPKTITLNFDSVEITLPNMSLDAPIGGAFSQKLSASGGTAPYTYKVTSGALPDGLAISGDEITGTPTVDGTFNFDVMATDANGATGTKSYSMVVKAVKANVANDAVVAIISSGAVYTYAHDFWQHVTDGDVYADQLNIKSISDSRVTIGEGSRPRPSYLYIPRAVRGDLDVQYSVTDVNGVESNTATIRFQITGDEMRLVVDESSKPEIGKMYGVSFIADLGTAPFSYTVSGAIPDGLKWEEDHNAGDSANFTLRGIPTAKGVYPISVTVTDSTGQSKTISHTIDLGEREVPTATDKTIKTPYGGSIDVDLSELAGGDWTSVGVYSTTGSYTLNGNVVSRQERSVRTHWPAQLLCQGRCDGTGG